MCHGGLNSEAVSSVADLLGSIDILLYLVAKHYYLYDVREDRATEEVDMIGDKDVQIPACQHLFLFFGHSRVYLVVLLLLLHSELVELDAEGVYLGHELLALFVLLSL